MAFRGYLARLQLGAACCGLMLAGSACTVNLPPPESTPTVTVTAETPVNSEAAGEATGQTVDTPAPPSPAITAATSNTDLGLSTPMTRPACDGMGIVVLHSAVNPATYASEVSAALANHPGAQYLRTDESCPSLRPRDDAGNAIYAVYLTAGYSKSSLCAAVTLAGDGAYGKWLDTTSDPSLIVAC